MGALRARQHLRSLSANPALEIRINGSALLVLDYGLLATSISSVEVSSYLPSVVSLEDKESFHDLKFQRGYDICAKR